MKVDLVTDVIVGIDPGTPVIAVLARRLRPGFEKVFLGFSVMGAAAVSTAAQAQDLANRMQAEAGVLPEATDGLLPRSFVSVDAMDWTPPAEGQEVPAWVA